MSKEAARQDAMNFLREVQVAIPDGCSELLDTLTKFRMKRCSSDTVERVALRVLDQHEDLAVRFGNFLPEKDRKRYLATVNQPLRQKRRRVAENAYTGPATSVVTGQHMYQANLKKSLAHSKNLADIWKQVCAVVQKKTIEIQKQGSDFIPVVLYSDIAAGTVPHKTMEAIRNIGVVKVRQSVPAATAQSWNRSIMSDLKSLLNIEPEEASSYDKVYDGATPLAPEFGGVQEVFYTRAQFEAREHKQMLRTRRWLNHFWKYRGDEKEQDWFLPDVEVTYADRLRHRLPGYQKQTGMKDHIDNGSLSHWADPAAQKVYSDIFDGRAEEYNPWDASNRPEAAGTFFRSWQGWLALTPQGEGDGTLEIVPMVKEAMVYTLLRPFLSDVPSHQFPGARDLGMGDAVEISSRWHSDLLSAKVSIGQVEPGDTVWWHPDVIHAVEQSHNGIAPSNVLYIASTPMCKANAKYLVRQRQAFEKGEAPPDFPSGVAAALEKGSDRCMSPATLSDVGRQMMGIDPYDESLLDKKDHRGQALLAECNKILFS